MLIAFTRASERRCILKSLKRSKSGESSALTTAETSRCKTRTSAQPAAPTCRPPKPAYQGRGIFCRRELAGPCRPSKPVLAMRVLRDMRFAWAAGIAASFLDGWSAAHGRRWGDIIALAFFVAYAYYCIRNFIECGEVHCAFSGPGFVLAAILETLRISGIWDRGYGLPWATAIAVLIIGYAMQSVHQARSGSIYSKRP